VPIADGEWKRGEGEPRADAVLGVTIRNLPTAT
jgi:hypothetical protein